MDIVTLALAKKYTRDAEDVLEAEVSIVDENLTTVVTEHIHHNTEETTGE